MSDIVGKILGNFGIWQLRSILIIFLCKIPASWFMACIIFTAPAPRKNEWYCKPPSEIENIELNKWINAAHPKYKNDRCQIYEDAVNRTLNGEDWNSINQNLIDCQSFVYKSDFYSLLMQFDLVCDRDILLAWSQYWHLFGILLGSVLAIKMMVYISPRKVMLSGMILQIICGALTGFLPDFNLNCLFRVNSAICCALMFVSGQAIFQDITGGKYKIGATTLYDTFWSIGLFLLPGLSNFFNNWSFIYLGITLPTFVLIFLYPWIPDSPRWLIKNGRIDEVECLLINAAKINERMHTIPSNLKQEIQNEINKTKSQSSSPSSSSSVNWCELWKGSKAIKNLISVHLAWAIYIINFMGLLLNIRSFPNGREYLGLNTIITGISEIIGCFLAMHFSCHSEHKWIYAGIFNIIVGLIGCLGWIFPNTWDDLTAMSMWMLISSIVKCGTSFAQSMLAACTVELVIPQHRQIFIFSCVVWSRAWLLTAPFVGVFKRIHIALSLSAYSLLSVIGGICLCIITPPKSASLSGGGGGGGGSTLTEEGRQVESNHHNGSDNENCYDNLTIEETSQYYRHQQQNIWTIPNNIIEKTKF